METMINDFCLKVSLPNDWDDIERVRSSLKHQLEACLFDEVFTSSVTMVSAELLENAIKYSDMTPEGGPPTIYFTVTGNGREVSIIVKIFERWR